MSKANQLTEIIYVCSPDYYENLLFTSVRSLLKSDSSFDKLTIFCIGQKPDYWEFLDPRVQVISVEALRQDDFLINKTYALTSQAERLIFLDTDTLIFNSLDTVYQGTSEDFIGRPASKYFAEGVRDKWEKIITKYGSKYVPYFNSGFFIFQNSSHHRLLNTWRNLTHELLVENSIPESFHGKQIMAEQMALSLTVSKHSLSYRCMEEHEHVYTWAINRELDPKTMLVIHTGGSFYFKYATRLEIKLGLIWSNLPKFKSYPNPIHFHRWKRVLIYLQSQVSRIAKLALSKLKPKK